MSRHFIRFLLILFLSLPILAYGQDSDAGLVLTSKSLGPLPLSKNTLVSESYLKRLFPKCKITHEIGQGDSPDFHIYEVTDSKGELLFTIKSFIDDSEEQSKQPMNVRIDILRIHSPRIKDAYGLRVGNRVKDIIKARGQRLAFGASHHDVYMGADQIYYNISTNSDRNPEEFSLNDAVRGNWPVSSISWPDSAWE